MEKQKYSIIFKVISWVLMIISVAVVIWGSVVGYPKTVAADNGTVDPLLYWTYIMIGIALCAVIVIGLIISIRNNPKSLLRMLLVIVAAAVLIGVAYLTASGAPAVGYTGAKLPSDAELKLTDTILNLAYILAAGAILSIICGEVIMALKGKKA